jgi:aryl-alcohol dehydrogenase-like predicted oxidoreductase
MEYRQLGRSGLRVSTITLGTMGFGGTGWASAVGRIDVEGARHQIALARDAGVNLFDTADVYSAGLSEQILGEALGKDRDDVLIATKVRGDMGPGPNDGGLSRYHVLRACEASLRRLNTDHIDLYQVHEWDGLTPHEETLSALDSLVQSGKVRYVGSSNYTARQLMKALWVSDSSGLESFVSEQIYYSLQARDAENELIPIAIDEGLGVLVWSPLAGGSSRASTGAGRRRRRAPAASRAGRSRRSTTRTGSTTRSTHWSRSARSTRLRRAGRARLHARQARGDVGHRRRPDGGPAPRQPRGRRPHAVRRGDRPLDDVSGVPLLYPYWHQANTAVGRLNPADLSLLGRHLPNG